MPDKSTTSVSHFWKILFEHCKSNSSTQDESAFFALENLGIISAQGPDAERFLQGQLTTDTAKQELGSVLLSGHCDHKGRLNANFLLCRASSDQFYLVLPSNNCGTAMQALAKYAVFSKVELQDISQSSVLIGCNQNNPQQVFKSCITQGQMQYFQALENDVFNFSIAIASLTDGVNRVEGNQTADNKLLDLCKAQSWQPALEWHLQRLSSGMAFINDSNKGMHIPQMINMDLLSAIDWDKGCYTGQEIIARMHYRGKANRRSFIFRSTLKPVTEDQELRKSLKHTSSESPILETLSLKNGDGESIGDVLELIELTQGELLGLAVVKLKSLNDELNQSPKVAKLQRSNASSSAHEALEQAPPEQAPPKQAPPEHAPSEHAIDVEIIAPNYLEKTLADT